MSLLVALLLAAGPQDHERAHALIREATLDYKAGDFDGALSVFTSAYKLEPAPELLFDLGQCHRALQHWERAAFFYRGYLDERCRDSSCPEVQALLADVTARARPTKEEARVEQRAPLELPAPLPATTILVMAPPESPRPVHHPRRAFWWLGGGALVAGAAWGIAGGEVLALRGQDAAIGRPLNQGPESATLSGWAIASDTAMALTLGLLVASVIGW